VEEGLANGKCLVRVCLAVFRSLNNVEKCTMSMRNDVDEDKLIFQLHCKMGVRKTYKLELQEGAPLTAITNHEACPNRLVILPKLLAESFGNFPHTLGEVTICLDNNTATIRSYIDDQKSGDDNTSVSLKTELRLPVDDFEKYEMGGDGVEVTFSLKETKAILSFCETANQPIFIYIDDVGKPIILSVRVFQAYDAEFVLATLIDQNESVSASQTSRAGSSAPVSRSVASSGMASSEADPSMGSQGSSGKRRSSDHDLSPYSPPSKRILLDDEEDEDEEEGEAVLFRTDLDDDEMQS